MARGADAESSRESRAGMGCAITVMVAFAADRKAAQPARAANRVEAVASARQEFMDVDLMTDIPDKLVLWSAEDCVESNSQLDHTKIWAEVPAVFREHGNHFLADLL